MRPRPAALATALALLLALPACDSSGPAPPDFVGTWTLQTSSIGYAVTVSQPQTITVYSRPALSGEVTVTGAVTASLRHVAAVTHGSDGHLELSSSPRGQFTPPHVGIMLSPSGTGGIGRDDLFLPLVSSTGAAPYVLGTGTLAVPGLRFADGRGQTALASGTLTFPTKSLPAGQETALDPEYEDPEPPGATRYTFERGGTLRVQERSGAVTRTLSGTWALAGEGNLRIRVTEGGTTDDALFAYRVEGDALTLTMFEDGWCPAECLRFAEMEHGLAPNTLSRQRMWLAFAFRRGTAAAPPQPPALRPEPPPGHRAHPLAPPVAR